jgi:hypothetical protein
MRIYSIEPHDDVQLLDTDVENRVSMLRSLGRGSPLEVAWRPLPVWRLQKPRKRRAEELCDLTAIGAAVDVPVMSFRAKQVLEPLIGKAAQWLPIAFDERDYWLLNTVRTLDVMDMKQSEVTKFPDGRVSGVEIYAFQEASVRDEWLFKVLTHPYRVLVTDRFRTAVVDNGLSGFHFQPVWDSEHRPFRPAATGEQMLERPEIYGPEGFVPNLEEYWPPEWKEHARQLKRLAKESAARGA